MLFVSVAVTPDFPGGSLLLWHLVIIVTLALALIIPLWAAVTLWRSRDRMDTTHVLIWAAVIIFAPFIGSLVWLFLGRELHGVRPSKAVAPNIRRPRSSRQATVRPTHLHPRSRRPIASKPPLIEPLTTSTQRK